MGRGELSKKIITLEASLEFHIKVVEEVKDWQTKFDARNKEEEEWKTTTKGKMDELDSLNKKLRYDIDRLERLRRENNIRICNFKQKDPQENVLKEVAKFILEHKLLPYHDSLGKIMGEIEYAHRIGLVKTGMERHIVIRLHSRPIRNKIMFNAKTKINSAKLRPVYFQDEH